MTHTLAFINESMDEHMERWAEIRRRRKAEGKCWQCAKPIADCTCPNVKHQKPNAAVEARRKAVASDGLLAVPNGGDK